MGRNWPVPRSSPTRHHPRGADARLAAALWFLTLVFFFPLVGWGFFGLAVTPKLIVAAAAAHLLFAVFLWGLSRLAFARTTSRAGDPR